MLIAFALLVIFKVASVTWLVLKIEEVSALDVQLRAAADRDKMTGLLNWSAFHKVVGAADARSCVAHDARKALLLIDIDNFKSVNDRWGHAAGDVVLRSVAERLAQQVGTLGVVGRLGGEEFGVFMGDASAWQAVALAHSLRTVISTAPIRLDDNSHVPLTISIGVIGYCAPTIGQTAMILADQLLYRAKANGRDWVEF